MDESPRYRPLYQQVYDFLVKQIAAGEWGPGESLPSEQALAGRLSVSQGTVRKALDALAADSLIDRRQGKGTYVAEHTQERALFRFFRMARPGGARAVPTDAQGPGRPVGGGGRWLRRTRRGPRRRRGGSRGG